MKKITVLLVDDHTVVREGLRVLVEAEGDIEVVGEAKTGREAVDMTLQLHPNVVVMDIAMPLLDGLAAYERPGQDSGLLERNKCTRRGPKTR